MGDMLIEMVCTGNLERSPIAELVGRNYLESIGAPQYYHIISSGVNVNQSPSDKINPVRLVSFALNKDVYSLSDISKIEKLLASVNNPSEAGKENAQTFVQMDDKTRAELMPFYDAAKNEFATRGRENRNEALLYFGIPGKLKAVPEQTTVRVGPIDIFCMDNKAKDGVIKIYEGPCGLPPIHLLAAVATDNMVAEIPNTFGLGRKEYFAAVEDIIRYTPKALDKLFHR